MITVPITRPRSMLCSVFGKAGPEEVIGMVQEENHCLVAKFNPPLTIDEIARIFGNVDYRIITATHEVNEKTGWITLRIHKIHIVLWKV